MVKEKIKKFYLEIEKRKEYEKGSYERKKGKKKKGSKEKEKLIEKARTYKRN